MTRSERLPGVDVLRGVAAMLVVLHHIHIRFRINGYHVEPFLPSGLAKLLFNTGYDAVVCFFVISGFLITRLSLRRWGTLHEISPAAFYGLRAARILPCLLLVVALSSVLHLLEVPPFVIRPERGSLAGAIVAALGFHVNWYEGRHGYLPGNCGRAVVLVHRGNVLSPVSAHGPGPAQPESDVPRLAPGHSDRAVQSSLAARSRAVGRVLVPVVHGWHRHRLHCRLGFARIPSRSIPCANCDDCGQCSL